MTINCQKLLETQVDILQANFSENAEVQTPFMVNILTRTGAMMKNKSMQN